MKQQEPDQCEGQKTESKDSQSEELQREVKQKKEKSVPCPPKHTPEELDHKRQLILWAENQNTKAPSFATTKIGEKWRASGIKTFFFIFFFNSSLTSPSHSLRPIFPMPRAEKPAEG